MTAALTFERHALEARGLHAPARLPAARRRRLGPAALLSLGLHALLIGGAVLWAQYRAPVALVPADTPPTVQLVMSPPGGEPSTATAPQPEVKPAPKAAPKEAAAAPKAPPPSPSPPEPTTQAAPSPSPPAQAAQVQPSPSPPTQAAQAQPSPSPPAPAATDDKLTFDLAEAESDTNALVTGDFVVPPSPDIKYHNRKPSYPVSAASHGEHGTVVMLIHVSADGLVSGMDMLQSSGYAALDDAVREAVVTWHFLPSIRDGQPVPSDFPMRFVFVQD